MDRQAGDEQAQVLKCLLKLKLKGKPQLNHNRTIANRHTPQSLMYSIRDIIYYRLYIIMHIIAVHHVRAK